MPVALTSYLVRVAVRQSRAVHLFADGVLYNPAYNLHEVALLAGPTPLPMVMA
jgi:hypothetical protein